MSEKSATVITRAAKIAKGLGAKLNLVHVVPPLESFYTLDEYVHAKDVHQEMIQNAEAKLRKFGEAFQIPEDEQWVVTDRPKKGIFDTAKQIHADLVVTGGHSQKAGEHALGSTAYSILQNESFDVLVVR